MFAVFWDVFPHKYYINNTIPTYLLQATLIGYTKNTAPGDSDIMDVLDPGINNAHGLPSVHWRRTPEHPFDYHWLAVQWAQ